MTRTAPCVSDCPAEEGTAPTAQHPPLLPRGTEHWTGSGVALWWWAPICVRGRVPPGQKGVGRDAQARVS